MSNLPTRLWHHKLVSNLYEISTRILLSALAYWWGLIYPWTMILRYPWIETITSEEGDTIPCFSQMNSNSFKNNYLFITKLKGKWMLCNYICNSTLYRDHSKWPYEVFWIWNTGFLGVINHYRNIMCKHLVSLKEVFKITLCHSFQHHQK